MMLPSSKLALVIERINRLIPPALTRQSYCCRMADNIDDVCNETIAGVVLKNAHDLKETIEKNS